MKITKLAHSCLLIEEGGARILIDPGTNQYTSAQNDVKNLDVILVTQTHQDHYDPVSIKTILLNNPGVRIFTNHEVQAELMKEGVASELLEHGQSTNIKTVLIEAFGTEHGPIYPGYPSVINTGFLIAGRFFHPGDGFHKPEKPVEILALPVIAPWMKSSEAIDYAKAVNPKVCFPIHDAFLKFPGPFYKLPQNLLPPIEFTVIEDGQSREF